MMRKVTAPLGALALAMCASVAVAESESVSSSTHESSSSTHESTSSTQDSSSIRVGGSGDTALSEQKCVTEVMSRVNTADVNVLSSRPIKDGVWVRVGVGPNRTPWHCVSRDDGSTSDVGPVRHSAHSGHQPGKADGHGAGGDDPFFASPGIYEQACLMDVEEKAGTLTAVVLGSEQTDKGLRVRIGVGHDRTPWHCLVQDSGATSDIGPDRRHGGHRNGP